jgi:hypothetical protein
MPRTVPEGAVVVHAAKPCPSSGSVLSRMNVKSLRLEVASSVAPLDLGRVARLGTLPLQVRD